MDFLYERSSLIYDNRSNTPIEDARDYKIAGAISFNTDPQKSLHVFRQMLVAREVQIVFDQFTSSRNRTICPYPEEAAKCLFLMFSGSRIDCWHDGQYVKLEPHYWTFFALKNMPHKAIVPAGKHRFMHMCFPDSILTAYRKKYPLFGALLESVEADGGGIVNKRDLRVSMFASCIASHMFNWRTENAYVTEVYFRALAVHMLSSFVVQLETEFVQPLDWERPAEEDVLNLLKKVSAGFKQNPANMNVTQAAAMAGVDPAVADQYYLERCYISATDLINYLRMTKAFRLILKEELTKVEIAGKLGLDINEMEHTFQQFFGCAIEEVYSLHKEEY